MDSLLQSGHREGRFREVLVVVEPAVSTCWRRDEQLFTRPVDRLGNVFDVVDYRVGRQIESNGQLAGRRRLLAEPR